MKLQFSTRPLSQTTSEFVILPFFEETKFEYLKDDSIATFLKLNPKFGKLFESQSFFLKTGNFTLLGLGKKDKLDFEKLQNWFGAAAKPFLTKAKQISIFLPKTDSLTPEQTAQAAALGIEIATHDPSGEFKYQKEKVILTNIELIAERAEKGLQDGLKKGQILADSINFARRLGDLPANILTPTYFLNEAKKVAKECKLKLTVLTEAQAKRKGMGAFCAVSAGSDEPSYMIALEYTGNLRSREKWAFVGKGITFDSGGLYFKPSPHMNEMKYDMCGAANVLAAIRAVVKLGVRVNLVAVMAVTENMVSGKAMKPGDILTTYCGKTVEITHTDAEGRVVLIDAVSWAQKDFKANKLVDLATLTGAVITALSSHYTGLFANQEELAKQLTEAGKSVGEKYWAFPMTEEYDEMIKGEMSDIINTGKPDREAGSITGAKFIQAGIEDKTAWAHLDIAGTAWDTKPKPFRSAGATGIGVKTLVELVAD